MKYKRQLVGVGFLVVFSGLAAGIYLFRSETYDNPDLGVMTFEYRWGRRAWQLLDSDRDGEIDTKARLAEDEIYAEEIWEDRNHDGSYEINMGLDGADIDSLKIDLDHDGTYDLHLVGTEAADYWAENYQR